MKIIYESVVNEATFSPCSGGPFIVQIYTDWSKGKLRVFGDDGIHGKHNVAFPNKFRSHNGDLYQVRNMSWNGTNYKVSEGDVIGRVSYGNVGPASKQTPAQASYQQPTQTSSQPAQSTSQQPVDQEEEKKLNTFKSRTFDF